MAGVCGRGVDVDDSQFRLVNFDHNGLVLEVGVVWQQGTWRAGVRALATH